jgi:hypothetical protein
MRTSQRRSLPETLVDGEAMADTKSEVRNRKSATGTGTKSPATLRAGQFAGAHLDRLRSPHDHPINVHLYELSAVFVPTRQS